MLCRKPFPKGGMLFPCGQCLPCRFNRRRIWSHRIMLEAGLRADNAFVTLTYDEENVRRLENGLATLVPDDLRDFLKRLRRAIEPHRIRFYAVGEYGDETDRPHYHLALFGYPACARGRTQVGPSGSCCASCDRVAQAWGYGRVFLGDLSVESAQYIAGYVVKKLTSESDPVLRGRFPEFSRMSLRPGIGADYMHEVASVLLQHDLEGVLEDVPVALRHGSRNLPLGRYLRRHLRELIGREKNAPQAAVEKMAEEMRPVREAAFDASRSFAAVAVEVSEGKYRQFEARRRLRTKRKTL